MTDADIKALCAHHNIDTRTVTADDGQPLLTITDTGWRTLADHAPNPARAHAVLDQLFAQLAELNAEPPA